MGMDVCMLGATILATPFSSDASVSSSLQSMAMSYFDDFVLVFKDKLLPVLVRAQKLAYGHANYALLSRRMQKLIG